MDPNNPFSEAAADGVAAAALHELEWQRQQQAWHAHVEACRTILRHGLLARLELARKAAEHWAHDAKVTGIHDTSTVNGVLHLRAKLMLDLGKRRFSHIEFIASPKSMVIACEAERPSSRKRWPRIALSADAVRLHADVAIREFFGLGVG